MVNGKRVCKEGYLSIMEITPYFFRKVKGSLLSGETYMQFMEKAPRVRIADKQILCKNWIQDYVDKFCCHDPSSQEIHLPCVMKKQHLYDIFYVDMTNKDSPVIGLDPRLDEFPSYATFLLAWKNYFKTLIIPRNHRLGKCVVCTQLKNKQPTLPRDGAFYKAVYDFHMGTIWDEKRNYADRVANSRLSPEKVGSIIIDFCTQRRIPHNSTSVKDWLSHEFVAVDLCGVINHGLNEEHFFPFLPHFRFTADVNISILHHIITNWKSRYILPEVLNIQADNCVSENKNVSLLAYLDCLVYYGYFTKVCYLNSKFASFLWTN
jgi:hypothetical protein